MNNIPSAINPFLNADLGVIKPIAGARVLSLKPQTLGSDPMRRMLTEIASANRLHASWPLRLRRIFSLVRTEVEKISFTDEHEVVIPEVVAPRTLAVGQLPEPAFHSQVPPRYFWHPSKSANENLLRENSDTSVHLLDNTAEILTRARASLPLEGSLKEDYQGFIYLDLPEAYTQELLPLIRDAGAEIPPYFTPHIVVVLPNERESRKGMESFKELGQTLSFELTGCYSLKPRGWNEMERVWVLTLKSPELEAFRTRALLPSKIFSHEFHIVIGAARSEKPALETFRINVSCYAA